MIRRSTWIVLGVFGLLLAFTLWWRARPADQAVGEATATLEPLWNVGAAQIVLIRVEDLQAGTTVEAELRADGAWWLLEPEAGPADTTRMEQAASWLALPIPRSQVAPVGDLADFGLDAPHQRVTARLDDGRELTFEVGDEAPTGTMTYVRLPDRAGVLVLSKYGLSEVLGLLDPLPIPEPTGTPSATASAEPPAGTPAATPSP
ncbi:MAG: hypothetical protein A2Y93_11590 [Chloroflexi bacterium RBG_13_68_17]|nr:MAG: hypothetical protein A2Y93_11590 [Chloroflexi bacterium RBG_13_68_17]